MPQQQTFHDKPYVDKAKRLAAKKAAALEAARFQPIVEVVESTRLSSAKARLEPADSAEPVDATPYLQPRLIIQLPKAMRWNATPVIQNLTQRVLRRHARHALIWHMYGKHQPAVTVATHQALHTVVERINAATLQSPMFKQARLGSAVKSRAAQMNGKTGVMTVARFILTDIPEHALRYLVIHELCHLTHMNHSRAFWSLVARHQPDYKIQNAVVDAHHYRLTLNIWRD
jgi:hypothetical protein